MRALITANVTAKQKPFDLSADREKYTKGLIIEVSDRVEDQDASSTSWWYKVNATGSYIIEDFLSTPITCSSLPDHDRNQYLIAFHQKNADGTIKEDSKSAPDQLYFAPTLLPPTKDDLVTVEHWSEEQFVNNIINSLGPLKDSQRHVFIYIPGYQLQIIAQERLDLLAGFTLGYMPHPENTIAKILFFSWPSQSGNQRRTIDDRSIALGEAFSYKGMFNYFAKLSDELKARGKYLNLLAHSFGHQLLNGIISPDSGVALQENIFENIFLMASDISYLSVKKSGVSVPDIAGGSGADTVYNLSGLSKLSKKINVFFDQYDYLLYFSSEKFSGKEKDIDEKYFNLGNYGKNDIDSADIPDNFDFFDINDLIDHKEIGTKDFPFRAIRNTSLGDDITFLLIHF